MIFTLVLLMLFFFLKYKQIAQANEAAAQQIESSYEQLRSEVKNDPCLLCRTAIIFYEYLFFKSPFHIQLL